MVGLAQSSLKRGCTQAANRHVLRCKNVLAPTSQYPVARLSVQVVCNKVFLGLHLQNSYHKKRLAAVQTMSATEQVFMLQKCASESVNNRSYRTLPESCAEGAPCALGQGSEALIGRFRIQALPTNREKTRPFCCTGSRYKILCCSMTSVKRFLRKRAGMRLRYKEHCEVHYRSSPLHEHASFSSLRTRTRPDMKMKKPYEYTAKMFTLAQ